MKVQTFYKILYITLLNLFSVTASFAQSETAAMGFTLNLNSYLRIESITSPVLIANITDRTGHLQKNLSSRFRVISNTGTEEKLYLKASVDTDNGTEDAIFEMNGKVYIAFSNTISIPKSQSLANCKFGGDPTSSPGIVAYPILSVIGGSPKYQRGRSRYELTVPNGTTDITVNIGSNVLKSSFADNDPNGFYKATLSLTDVEI